MVQEVHSFLMQTYWVLLVPIDGLTLGTMGLETSLWVVLVSSAANIVSGPTN